MGPERSAVSAPLSKIEDIVGEIGAIWINSATKQRRNQDGGIQLDATPARPRGSQRVPHHRRGRGGGPGSEQPDAQNRSAATTTAQSSSWRSAAKRDAEVTEAPRKVGEPRVQGE